MATSNCIYVNTADNVVQEKLDSLTTVCILLAVYKVTPHRHRDFFSVFGKYFDIFYIIQ